MGLLLLLSISLLAPCATHHTTLAVAQTQTPTPQVRPRRVNESTDATPSQTPAPPTPTPQPSTETSSPPPADDESIADDDEVVRINSNLVIVPASVVDARGRAVTDLKLEDFELRVDGEVKSISDLSRAATPVYITLLFDNSASLSQARAFEKEAAVRFLRSIVRPIDRAAIYSVATSALLAQPFTNDVQKLVGTIERFGEPEGATALFDAIVQASHYLQPLVGRKVIVIVSDGTDTISDVTFEQAVQRALRADCQVYVVQTRQIEHATLHNPITEAQLAKLTEQTGGAVYVPQAVAELDEVFTQIARDLSQQYLLSYYPQDNRKDKFFRFIEVRVKSRPHLRVRARKGFFPNEVQNQTALLLENIRAHDRVTNSTARTETAATSVTKNETATLAQNTRLAETQKLGPGSDDEARQGSAPNVAANAQSSPPAQASTQGVSAAMPKTNSTSTPPVADSTTTRTTPPVAPSNDKSTQATSPKAETATQTPVANGARETAASKPVESEPKAPVSGGALNSKALYLPKPIYPQAAKSTGASGKVIVEVMIDEKGKVIAARAVSGPTLLQAAAVSAARQAKFSPTLVSGEPVRVTGTISYTFIWP